MYKNEILTLNLICKNKEEDELISQSYKLFRKRLRKLKNSFFHVFIHIFNVFVIQEVLVSMLCFVLLKITHIFVNGKNLYH